MKPKVFGIGLQKTGTTSLGKALSILGYRVQGYFLVNQPGNPKKHLHIDEPITQEKLAAAVIPIAEQYDAFEDNPWCVLYHELDVAFPGSKFILTRRDPQTWINSMTRHFGDRRTPMSEFLYGPDTPALGNESVYVDRYLRHNADVLNYFAGRPDDLLVIDLEQAGWEPLCKFLGRPVPMFRSFPHRNSSKARARTAWIQRKREQFIEPCQNALRRITGIVSKVA
jgi:hypothetical protein